MDDQSPKPNASQTNIDELVKELSRPQGAPASPAPATAPSGNQAPAMPARPATLQPAPNPAPAAPKPNQTPAVPPAPSAPVTPAAPKEYQSSIRTMTDDLSKLKAGQQPQGVNIPRKVEPVAPVPAKPAPAPAPAKPMPSSSMPSSVKSAPLPASSSPTPAPKPAPAPIPRPTAPAGPAMPPSVKSPELKPDQKNQFYVPPVAASGSSGSGRNLLMIGILVAMVLFGGLYWYFMIRDSGTQVADTPVVTFTPRPTATPILGLEAIFPNKGGAIVLSAQGNPVSAINNAIQAQVVTPGSLIVAPLLSNPIASGSPEAIGLTDLFDRSGIAYPADMKQALSGKFDFLVYGQKENFDAKGQVTTSPIQSNRAVLVSELVAPIDTSLKAWELTLDNTLSGMGKLLGVDVTKNKKPFQDNSYKGVAIRFKNYPYADHAIDYGMIQYNGKTYLIFAGSREAMFATIDAFLVSGK